MGNLETQHCKIKSKMAGDVVAQCKGSGFNLQYAELRGEGSYHKKIQDLHGFTGEIQQTFK